MEGEANEVNIHQQRLGEEGEKDAARLTRCLKFHFVSREYTDHFTLCTLYILHCTHTLHCAWIALIKKGKNKNIEHTVHILAELIT